LSLTTSHAFEHRQTWGTNGIKNPALTNFSSVQTDVNRGQPHPPHGHILTVDGLKNLALLHLSSVLTDVVDRRTSTPTFDTSTLLA